ncbi:Gfo/Idh/MocA family oxidoreductase [Verrucomicrobiales bacterium BCK34]|nr:Gfo/Idh/MocA family oxidoreductase [Verrucomicrobiales bacterium BCK34]
MAEEGTEDFAKRHVIYGSAGMAAAGMIPSTRKKSTAPKEEEEEAEQSEEIEAVVEAPAEEAASPEPPVEAPYQGVKAAVIGHTGSGDFGRGLDRAFQRINGARLIALTDINAEKAEDSQIKSGAKSVYHAYQRMIGDESPDLVVIASSWTGERLPMGLEALNSDAHLFCEVPFTRTLKEADELLALANKKGLKVAVNNQLRCDPNLVQFHEQYPELIGELLEMRVFGAMGDSAGGEDLLTSGLHLFDIVRWFAGEMNYCTASVLIEGEIALAEDAEESENGLGPILGDAIHAQFSTSSGVKVSFVSDNRFQSLSGGAGIEFIGSKAKARLFADFPATLSLVVEDTGAERPDRTEIWKQWPATEGDYHPTIDKLNGLDACNRLVLTDVLASITEDRDPLCSGENAMKALEMVHGVWQAATTMKRAYFPLANRLHPLSEDSQ